MNFYSVYLSRGFQEFNKKWDLLCNFLISEPEKNEFMNRFKIISCQIKQGKNIFNHLKIPFWEYSIEKNCTHFFKCTAKRFIITWVIVCPARTIGWVQQALNWTWEKPVKASKFETVDVIYQKDDCEQYINDYLGWFWELQG